jgi:hypothetical protein
MTKSRNRNRGHPTKYSRSLVDEICTRLEGSDMGLARMLDEARDLPCSKTVWTWMAAKPDFSQKIAEAKERQLESMQHRGVELIDRVDCNAPLASIVLAQAKAPAEARFKLAAKIAPRKYGSHGPATTEPETRVVIVEMDAQDGASSEPSGLSNDGRPARRRWSVSTG